MRSCITCLTFIQHRETSGEKALSVFLKLRLPGPLIWNVDLDFCTSSDPRFHRQSRFGYRCRPDALAAVSSTFKVLLFPTYQWLATKITAHGFIWPFRGWKMGNRSRKRRNKEWIKGDGRYMRGVYLFPCAWTYVSLSAYEQLYTVIIQNCVILSIRKWINWMYHAPQ